MGRSAGPHGRLTENHRIVWDRYEDMLVAEDPFNL
jgi:hypothetical protein